MQMPIQCTGSHLSKSTYLVLSVMYLHVYLHNCLPVHGLSGLQCRLLALHS